MRVISSRWLRPCPLYTPPVAPTDWMTRWNIGTVNDLALLLSCLWELSLTSPFRGRWSRNKVSVGEPAEGSLPHLFKTKNKRKPRGTFSESPECWSLRPAKLLHHFIMAEEGLYSVRDSIVGPEKSSLLHKNIPTLIFTSLILTPWVDKTSNWPETHSVVC